MNNALVLGGGRGIGLAVVKQLLKRDFDTIYIVGLHSPEDLEVSSSNRVKFIKANFVNEDLSFLREIDPVNFLFISVGFGRVAKFSDLKEIEISNSIKVNQLIITKVLHYYFSQINSQKDFFSGVMVSISGLLSSPLFSVYGSTKAALAKLIESLNIELLKEKTKNRILDISPGHIEGTSFYGKDTNLKTLDELAINIIEKIYCRETLYIPKFDEVYNQVLKNYNENPTQFGIDSYNYKKKSERISTEPQLKVGYLSGTFDLFHIGHLNLLKRAKEYCDYLVVGVHESGKWKGKDTFVSFENRVEIVKSIKYVDKVIPSFTEDSDAYESVKYDYLFVGSDYKGTERFNKYEQFFKDKGVQIIYFPYTKDVSSTELRDQINKGEY